MMKKFMLWLVPLLLAVLVAVLLVFSTGGVKLPTSPGRAEKTTPRISWRDCDSRIVSPVPISCGHFHPAEARGRFALPFAIFHYSGTDAPVEPLVYIAGGPGAGMQTGDDRLQAWSYWLEEAGLRRDLILFDQRGLKPGEPYWDCAPYTRISARLLEQNLALEEEYRRTAPVLEQCLRDFDQWLKSTAVGVTEGIKSFSSSSGATDLNEMLALLGYRAWALWGVSYGSRLALVAAQQAPETVTHLILDSPYPLDQGLLSAKPALYSRALDRFDKHCRNNPENCAVTVEDPLSLFWRVMDKLRESPRTVRVGRVGNRSPVVLNDHRLLALTIFTLYDPRLYGELLTALVALDEGQPSEPRGNRDSLELLLELFVASALDEDFNAMVFFAIECNDNPLETTVAYEVAAQAFPALHPYTTYEAAYNVCALPLFDPEARVGPEPVPGMPALVLSGELDPATPADWARSLAAWLPQARLQVMQDVGHAVLAGGGCQPRLLEAYLREPRTVDLQAYCP